MSLHIPYSQAKSADEAFKLAKNKITPDYVSQFKVTAEVKYDEVKKAIKAKGSGFELSLLFEDHGCCVDLELSFLLKPLKNKIIDKIEGQLKANI